MATLEELLQEGDTDYIHDDVIFFIDTLSASISFGSADHAVTSWPFCASTMPRAMPHVPVPIMLTFAITQTFLIFIS